MVPPRPRDRVQATMQAQSKAFHDVSMFRQNMPDRHPSHSMPGQPFHQSPAAMGKSSEESKPTSSGVLPTISLPKAGGAIGGMGEIFEVSQSKGTASLSIPIATSPARGLEPSLSLTYDSGNGNSEFGLGWSLAHSAITRKTSKGIPRYSESDVFLLAGADDLVPIFKQDSNGKIQIDQTTKAPRFQEQLREGCLVRRYSSRVDQSFLRIERWSEQSSGSIHWRTITSDNITSIYGKDNNSTIYNPSISSDDPQHVFTWLIAERYDSKGNAIIYRYRAEDSVGVNTGQANEKNRTNESRSANRYLTEIKYGNKIANRETASWKAFSAFDLPNDAWLFTVVFDYGQYNQECPLLTDNNAWSCRMDPFSSYRSGFEIRTYRLCRRILMFHHFPSELGRQDYLVTSTDVAYDENPFSTYLSGATHIGYFWDDAQNNYKSKNLPPLQFEYSSFPSDFELSALQFREMDSGSLCNLPYGFDNASYQWIDIDGEGLPGVLTEQASTWYYKRNMSANNCENPTDDTEMKAKLGPVETVATRPVAPMNDGRSGFADVKGDGHKDLIHLDAGVWGYYSREVSIAQEKSWMPFHEFKSFPNINPTTSEFRFMDLTGDGLPDLVITESHAFLCYSSLGKDGYRPAFSTSQSLDEEKGPRLVFSDLEQTIYIADMSGDGLPDLVRIRNGEICYWPNTGYGTFGAKVTMDNCPTFAGPDQFNQCNIRIGDIDGSGTSDILYIHASGVDIYLNYSGNNFSDRKTLHIFENTMVSTVTAIDLLGTGTISLVWSSTAPSDVRTPIKYVDLTNGKKPHLLIAHTNNLGSETRIHYSPSTKFYLDDRQSGRAWLTRLPFPVQCVRKVETFDYISNVRFVKEYAYHHGYFDGNEREYRGFAMVEEWDTDYFEAMATGSDGPSWSLPPTYTRTWLHTGAKLKGDLGRSLANEYYNASSLGYLDTVVEEGNNLNCDEEHEAFRALAGRVLRQEIYGLDGTTKSDIPYTIVENNYTVQVRQTQENLNRHVIATVSPRETISTTLERNSADPRINQSLVIQVDGYGNILKKVDVAYGRKASSLEGGHSIEGESLISYSEHRFTNHIDDGDEYILPKPCESILYQLHGLEPEEGKEKFTVDEFTKNNFAPLLQLPESTSDEGSGKRKKLFQKDRIYYLNDDLSQLLDLGKIEVLSLVGETYKLAFTPELLSYGRQSTIRKSLLRRLSATGSERNDNVGGYVDLQSDGCWWIPSGRSYFSVQGPSPERELEIAKSHFFGLRRTVDPFGNNSTVTYDEYDLLPITQDDALGNTTTSEIDYRVMQPAQLTDPNGNRTRCAFDELGRVIGTAVMGKATESIGDSLDGFNPCLDLAKVELYFQEPAKHASELLSKATTRIVYDIFSFDSSRLKRPNWHSVISRETHVSDQMDEEFRNQISIIYHNGTGQTIQQKMQAEDNATPCWITSGWQVLNRKGKPIRQYVAFFDASHEFTTTRKDGAVCSYTFYDSLARVVATLNPNHTWTKSVIESWFRKDYDENDAVLINPKTDEHVACFAELIPESEVLPTWHDFRIDGSAGPQEKLAAERAAEHANTPTTTCFDSLGREYLTIVDNGEQGSFSAFRILDIKGNEIQIVDPNDRVVAHFKRTLVGEIFHEFSMETGERLIVEDVCGREIHVQFGDVNLVSTSYDALRRPTEIYLLAHPDYTQKLMNRTIYGESCENSETRNLRTKVFQRHDQAGGVLMDNYDFRGNLISTKRRLVKEYKGNPDWGSATAIPEEEEFNTVSTYDALNRITSTVAPDGSCTRYSYDQGGLLARVNVTSGGTDIPVVQNILYNARQQRIRIDYGNQTSTTYEHDPLTFRLVGVRTTRKSADHRVDVQNLRYTYDPVGNVISVRDNAQQTIFFRNQIVEPNNVYKYDAIYRLIQATGREHVSLSGHPIRHNSKLKMEHPHNGKAIQNYEEEYKYDQSGNFLEVRHSGDDPQTSNWACKYEYDESSQLEPHKQSNRVSRTIVGSVSYNSRYDDFGNTTAMVNLAMLRWDYRNQLRESASQIVEHGVPDTTYYVYDSSGQRIRKIKERQTGSAEENKKLTDRIYLGNYELVKKFKSGGTVEQRTLHIKDHEDVTIALIETRESKQFVRYQIGNHLGSVTLELGDEGQLFTYEEYTPYGNTSYLASPNEKKTSKRYRYNAKERDKETGLYYYGKRYYAPSVSRWISCDPIGIGDGLNLYLFCHCNPVTTVDRDGTVTTEPQARSRTPSTDSINYWERSRTASIDSWTSAHDYFEDIGNSNWNVEAQPVNRAETVTIDLESGSALDHIVNFQETWGGLGQPVRTTSTERPPVRPREGANWSWLTSIFQAVVGAALCAITAPWQAGNEQGQQGMWWAAVFAIIEAGILTGLWADRIDASVGRAVPFRNPAVKAFILSAITTALANLAMLTVLIIASEGPDGLTIKQAVGKYLLSMVMGGVYGVIEYYVSPPVRRGIKWLGRKALSGFRSFGRSFGRWASSTNHGPYTPVATFNTDV